MLLALAWSYFALFIVITPLEILDGVRHGVSRWITGLELAVAITASFGFLFLMLHVQPPQLVTLWKLVVPVLIAGEVASSIASVRNLERTDSEFSDERNAWKATLATAIAILLVTPILFANFVLAYCPQLWPAV